MSGFHPQRLLRRIPRTRTGLRYTAKSARDRGLRAVDGVVDRLARLRAAPPAGASPVRLATPALRLVEVAHGADAVALLVEVQPVETWTREPWAGARVCGVAHFLKADGSADGRDGPRSDPFTLRWAPLRAPVFAVHVPRAKLRRAAGVEVDLVVEGVAWGADHGVETLRVPLEGAVPPGTAPRPGRGVPPWPAPFYEVLADLSSAWPEGADPQAMQGYVATAAARFLFTVQLVLAGAPARCLEIGSNPYFATRLLRAAAPGMALHGTNWFGSLEAPREQAVVDAAGAEVGRFGYDLVDIEAHRFPYDDGAFDAVLFGEVIEHLIADPVHALREIHRVLEPGGRLVLTTPVVSRAENVVRMQTHRSIYDPYSAHGPHGRHNREYDAEELFEILEGNGFEVRRHVTRPVHGVSVLPDSWFSAADDDGRGDYHFIEAVRGATREPHRPAWLYR